ncbi:MAG: DUF5666 domain-containing protein, partial [Marinicella sp.]
MKTSIKKNMRITILLTFLCILTSASAADDQPIEIMAQGGTGFTINGYRTFEVNDSTVYKQDGEIIPEILAQGGTGFKARYRVSDANPSLTGGTLEEINFINIYKGPVVSVDPLRVFAVQSLITNETIYTDGLKLSELSVGDVVNVSGFIGNNSSSIVSRIELVDELSEWKISGYVEDLNALQFSIDSQVINYEGATISGCGPSLSVGDFVEVFFTQHAAVPA